jgi:hypothetical protein
MYDVEEATAHALQIILEHKVLFKLSKFTTDVLFVALLLTDCFLQTVDDQTRDS